jgi:hypothetical protein
VNFPEQIQGDTELPGEYLNASFSADDITDFDIDGTIYSQIFFNGGRGVYRLGNGNLLATAGDGVWELDPLDGSVIEQEATGSARFIEFVPGGVAPLDVSMDIKPGSCPNPLNIKSKGKLPIALLGTEEFEVLMVDTATVALKRADGIGGEVYPNEGPVGPHSVIEDVATPFDGDLCDCHELGPDGWADLSMKFIRPEVIYVLELNTLPPDQDEVELMLTGELMDGTPFEAHDCVKIVGRGSMTE